MPDSINVYRVHDLAADIADQNARMRAVIAKSKDLLQAPLPDTFLGRATHDLFSKQSDWSWPKEAAQ